MIDALYLQMKDFASHTWAAECTSTRQSGYFMPEKKLFLRLVFISWMMMMRLLLPTVFYCSNFTLRYRWFLKVYTLLLCRQELLAASRFLSCSRTEVFSPRFWFFCVPMGSYRFLWVPMGSYRFL